MEGGDYTRATDLWKGQPWSWVSRSSPEKEATGVSVGNGWLRLLDSHQHWRVIVIFIEHLM